jgi:Leucine-rich repeat (LRR) protein
MTLKVVAALILAIPTYGISLVLLVVYKFYQAGQSVNSLEKVLVHLGNEGVGERTCFSEISYLQARAFFEEKGEYVESVNLNRTYLFKHSGGALLVEVDKEPQDQGAIFRVVNNDWLVDLQKWARAGNLPEKNVSLIDLYNLEGFTDTPLDSTGEFQLDKDIEELPPNFHRLPKLEKLWLRSKPFESLGTNIGKIRSLRVLHVSECSSIPSEIGRLESLESVYFLDGSVERIPDEIGMLQNLRRLILNGNRISSVPSSLGGLKQLSTLDLCRNQIGSLPDLITANDAIRTLLLGDNQLSRLPRFPKRPSRYKSMHEIDLSFNQFDTIPESILDIDFLDTLIMCGNPMTSLTKNLSRLNVKSFLVFGEQKHLKLSQDQVEWLKHKNDNGCEIWLACDDLVLGDVSEWKERIERRWYFTIGDPF